MKFISKILSSIVTIFLLSSTVWADSNNRIENAKSKPPATGRILVPVVTVLGEGATLNNLKSGLLPTAVSSTAIGGKFTKPDDYVSGDITLKAIISGCAGSAIAITDTYSPAVTRINIGANFFSPLGFSCVGFSGCPTISMPINEPPALFTTIAVSSTLESFADINSPLFVRSGDDINDDCAGDITVHGFIVEYPKSRKRGR